MFCLRCKKDKNRHSFSKKNLKKDLYICKKCVNKYWKEKTGVSTESFYKAHRKPKKPVLKHVSDLFWITPDESVDNNDRC